MPSIFNWNFSVNGLISKIKSNMLSNNDFITKSDNFASKPAMISYRRLNFNLEESVSDTLCTIDLASNQIIPRIKEIEYDRLVCDSLIFNGTILENLSLQEDDPKDNIKLVGNKVDMIEKTDTYSPNKIFGVDNNTNDRLNQIWSTDGELIILENLYNSANDVNFSQDELFVEFKQIKMAPNAVRWKYLSDMYDKWILSKAVRWKYLSVVDDRWVIFKDDRWEYSMKANYIMDSKWG